MAYDEQELRGILAESEQVELDGDEGFDDQPDYSEIDDDAFDTENTDDDDDDTYGYEAYGDEDDQILTSEEEQALAFELMTLQSEADLEEFLGKLFRKAKKGISKLARRARKKLIPAAVKFVKGPGRKLLAKALPMIGTAVGTAFAPGAGTQIGGAAGGVLGNLLGGGGGAPAPAAPGFGAPGLPAGWPPINSPIGGPGGLGPLAGPLGGGGNPFAQLLGSGNAGNLLGALMGGEMEQATLEEAKLDLSKRLVRTMAQAAGDAATDSRATSNPRKAARSALAVAVRRNIPAGVRQVLAASTAPGATGAPAGTWVRQGNQIVLFGA